MLTRSAATPAAGVTPRLALPDVSPVPNFTARLLADQLDRLKLDGPCFTAGHGACLSCAKTLNESKVKDVIELADMTEMEVKKKSGLPFGEVRRLVGAAKEEKARREAVKKKEATAKADAARKKVERKRKEAAERLGPKFKDQDLLAKLRSSELMADVGEFLVKESLTSMKDLDGITPDIFIELGLAEEHAEKLALALWGELPPAPAPPEPESEPAGDPAAAKALRKGASGKHQVGAPAPLTEAADDADASDGEEG